MPDERNLDEPAEVHWFRGEHSSADDSWGEPLTTGRTDC